MSTSTKRLVLLLLLLDVIVASSFDRSYRLAAFLTDAKVVPNLKYLNTSTNIRTTATDNSIDVVISLFKEINDPWITTTFWLNVAPGTIQAPLYNRTIGFCEFIANPSVHRLAQIVHREMRRNGNMPTKCPIQLGLYAFRGVSPSAMRMPAFFFEAQFILDVVFGVGQERIYTSRWFGMMKKIKCTTGSRCP